MVLSAVLQCSARKVYIKGGFCGDIPKFSPSNVFRYDPKSLAYSWEEGRYHFIMIHYYPTYEHAKIRVESSLEWLERDLDLANQAGLTSVLFVHAAQGLDNNKVLERVLLGRNLAAIFAGHTHRCLFRKCEGLIRLSVEDVENLDDGGGDTIQVDKCLPASDFLCGRNADGNFMSLFYLSNVSSDVELPERELYVAKDRGNPLCPKRNHTYINETDQTLLCQRALFSQPNFPFSSDAESSLSGDSSGESIPIFWSGSANFETFLRADFYNDRIVVNALTAVEGSEGQRYIDAHSVPNAVYPYHNPSDFGGGYHLFVTLMR